MVSKDKQTALDGNASLLLLGPAEKVFQISKREGMFLGRSCLTLDARMPGRTITSTSLGSPEPSWHNYSLAEQWAAAFFLSELYTAYATQSHTLYVSKEIEISVRREETIKIIQCRNPA